jgi:DNA-binding MarR family transcriptional regulator
MDATKTLIKIRKIVRSINLESKRIQKEYGVSIPQILCMDYLYRSGNFQATQKAIRDYMNLNSSTVTGIISRLEGKGHIARLPKKADKRTTYISLTSRGEKLLKSMPPLLHERLTSGLEELPDKKIEEVERSLDLIIGYLDIEKLDALPLLTFEEDI